MRSLIILKAFIAAMTAELLSCAVRVVAFAPA
jgi:hypothetical protein